MSTPTSAKQPLPIGTTVAAIFRLLWGLRDELLRIGIVPLAISCALFLPARMWPGSPLAVLMVLGQVVPMALFAVAWFRFVLLSPATAGSGLPLQWGERETRMLIRLVQLLLAVGLAAAVPLVLVMPLGDSIVGFLLRAAIFIGAQFLFLRWALVLPAAAVDHPASFAKSWAATADCGPQMVGIALLFNLPVFAFDLLLWQSGLIGALPYSMLLVENAASYVGTAGLLSVLAFVFRSRSDWRGNPAERKA